MSTSFSLEGDLHEEKYNDLGQTASLTTRSPYHSDMFSAYLLKIYPTDEFIESYSTNNPQNATIVAISIVVLITILFFIYDFYVRREFHERKQVLKAKRAFIRYVSHEVRTPLNAVLMGLNIIQNDVEDPESATLIQEIQASANSAVDVLNEVLQYDKIEQKNLNLELTKVDIWSLVSTQILNEFKLSSASKNINLEIVFDVNCPCCQSDVENGLPTHIRNLKVIGDRAKLLQVLRNLISNALKFTPKDGSVVLTVSYFSKNLDVAKRFKRKSNFFEKVQLKTGEEILATPSGYFHLQVKDSGVGMNASQIDRLFGEGVQFNANDLQAGKGSGLGLFIAKSLVEEQHKGTLTASSDGIGKGSEFTLRLPLYQCNITAVTEENQAVEDSASDSSPTYERKKLNILVVDDVSSNRKLLCRLLERSGHKTSSAENGAIALEMVKENMKLSDGDEAQYDSILMDYEMPMLNGPNATAEIRKIGVDIFIVGITGNTLNDDVQFFKSKGANAVLPKPVRLDALDELFVEYGM